jgi:transposase
MDAADPRDQIIAELRALLKAAYERIAELEARLKQNSTNSSKPPSTDAPGTKGRNRQGSKRKAGGQPGHKRHLRELVPSEKADHVHVIRPQICMHCRAALQGSDEQPLRHQVTEIPVVEPTVSEWQLHQLQCGACGRKI